LDSSQQWIEKLSELRGAGVPCAMVVVTNVKGSAPREPGARMIVARSPRSDTAELVFGTIGGGHLEHVAIERAGELLLSTRARSESVSYPLSDALGQCCGGEVTLFYETFPWTRRRVVIFGAGHVAQALGGLAPYLGADVVLIDGRDEKEIRPPLPKERPFELLLVDHPEAEIDTLADDAYVLVMTHSHALDLEVIARAVKRPFPYIGLIGSRRKWLRFQKRLLERGYTEAELARVRCPIGLSKRSKEPRAIAISTAAELLDAMALAAADRSA